MTNPQYNLTQDVSEEFEFTIGSEHFLMRYPTGEENTKLQKLGKIINDQSEILEQAKKDKDQTAQNKAEELMKKTGEEMSEFFQGLIRNSKKEGEPIDKVLEKATSPVIRNFQSMIQTELSLEAEPKVRR